MSKCAKVELNPVTNGAYVDQDRQTKVEGIYACGNVLHVHDLVDFVSEEAEIAGESAADYIMDNHYEKTDIKLEVDGKIRYTVPSQITAKKEVKIYFRVSDVFRNVKINVSSDNGIILSKKTVKVAPGEMECITLKKEMLNDISKLNFSLEVL